MSEKLYSIIKSGIRERRYVEETTIGGIIVPLIKMNESTVYIYGGGNDIESVILFFKYLDVDIKGVIDSDINKRGKTILNKVPYLHIDDLSHIIDIKKINVCIINTIYFKELEETEIINKLTQSGIQYIYELTHEEKCQIKAINPNYKQLNFAKFFNDNINELKGTYDNLYDNSSKDAFCEYIRVYMQAGVYHLYQCDGRFKYFFGADKDGKREELYEKYEEVWINCGANKGDNIFLFFQAGLSAKKIYAYEGDGKAFRILNKNINLLPTDIRKKVVAQNEMIDTNTDFDNIINERVTLINADIEGEEQSLIKAMKNIIVRDRPVVAICIYHRADDLINIPMLLKEYVDDYIFVVRKYWASVFSVNGAAELVLYAIPPERFSDEYVWFE